MHLKRLVNKAKLCNFLNKKRFCYPKRDGKQQWLRNSSASLASRQLTIFISVTSTWTRWCQMSPSTKNTSTYRRARSAEVRKRMTTILKMTFTLLNESLTKRKSARRLTTWWSGKVTAVIKTLGSRYKTWRTFEIFSRNSTLVNNLPE